MQKTGLITGGAGFIGSHLADRLHKAGWNVRVLDNFSSGSHANLPRAANNGPSPYISVIEDDVRNYCACAAACAGVDTVFHMAAIASVSASVADPIACHDVNLTGTLNLLHAAREANVRRFVFSSSASVYGDADTVPTREEQPIRPLSPYATNKASGEMYCRNFHEVFGLETVILRYFNVFGPRQSPFSGYAAAIPRFVHAAVTRTKCVVFGDGCQTRDFVYAGDVAEANLRASLRQGVAGDTFNIAGGHGTSILDLLAHLRVITGAPLEPDYHPARVGEVLHSRAETSWAKTGLGFQPRVSLAEGLRRTVVDLKGRCQTADVLATSSTDGRCERVVLPDYVK